MVSGRCVDLLFFWWSGVFKPICYTRFKLEKQLCAWVKFNISIVATFAQVLKIKTTTKQNKQQFDRFKRDSIRKFAPKKNIAIVFVQFFLIFFQFWCIYSIFAFILKKKLNFSMQPKFGRWQFLGNSQILKSDLDKPWQACNRYLTNGWRYSVH